MEARKPAEPSSARKLALGDDGTWHARSLARKDHAMASPQAASRLDGLLTDLAREQEALGAVLAPIEREEWLASTPAPGWAVRDQVSHLAYFDASAALALVAPDRFAEHKRALLAGKAGGEPDVALGRTLQPSELFESWRSGTADLLEAATARASAQGAASDLSGGPAEPVRHPSARVAWYGPDMSLASFLTARLMETWAHGQDVRDALGLAPSVSDRLRHVCHLGVSARRYAHAVHGVEDDGTPVRVEAVAPAGETWAWGPDDAEERISGSALGLAFVFTQRRHVDDTDVRAVGPAAVRWVAIAQAYAGPAGPGRPRMGEG
jgi:uncharacterized protein (TIGR03083 family)